MTALNGLLADTPTGSVNLFQCDSGNYRDYRFDNRSDFGISTFFKSGIFNMTTERTSPYSTDYENTETSILSFTAKGCARTKDPEDGSLARECKHSYDNMPGLFPEFDIVAANCSLHPCLRRYNANVVNGVLDEKPVSTAPVGAANISYVQANIADDGRNTYVFRNFSYVALSEPCIIKDTWYDSSNISQAPRDGVDWTSWGTGDTLHEAPSECLVLMDPTEFLGIRRFFLQTLRGSCAKTTSGSNRPTSSLENGRINCEGGFWVDAFFNSGNATFDDISTAFDNMATALTNRMRAKGHTQQTYLDKQQDGSDGRQPLPLMQLAELEAIADATKARFCSGRDVAGFIVDKTPSEAT
ncbi:hypothetical protein K4K60_008237 [Colletotrichum sp. SAR11_57]|nr:hypothetical protein K4K60_008237 [Colletotrichum sp. SAR11_57]